MQQINESTTSKMKSRIAVCFSIVEIREYEVALSSHSSCSSGPGLGLGWKYSNCHPISVDDYEKISPSAHRRDSQAMIIPWDKREMILKEVGYSRRQIEESRVLIHPKNKRMKERTLKKAISKILQIKPLSRRPSISN